jgi:serine/threonine protein kinase/tetratricopeptide (TPR) repeat protein
MDNRPFHSPGELHGSLSVVERLAEDMVSRWHQGERPLTEFYLERFPHLQQSTENILELIAEELALREQYAEPITLAELNQRFPLWPAQLRALVQCQRTLGPRSPQFPAPGAILGEFHLISELGRGAHARVFLAAQPSLGNRSVVLKLGPATSHEHLSLARLQHTHIVPLYSVHDFSTHGLRGLCLPYFGGAALNEVLARVRPHGPAVTGADLLAALPRERTSELQSPPDGQIWGSLKTAAFADVICWIGACLADALQYAHERGLLHLDLKPSNVLVAADGVPMLLDFHLARPPLKAGDAAPPWLGGTPGYMPPEQLDAVQAVRDGSAIPRNLDARADVYALGVVLREALSNPAMNSHGLAASVGLADVIARATATAPDERYPTALALANDLRRHLANLALSGVPNRSVTERWRKWRRRRPHALPILLALGALTAGFGGLTVHTSRLAERAKSVHGEGLSHLLQGHSQEAIESFRSSEMLAEGLPFHRELRAQLRDSKLMAERAFAADELHALCEQIRPLYAAELATPTQSQLVERRCRELWDQRDTLAEKLQGQMTPERERRWRADLLDVAILLSRLRERSTASPAKQEIHREALRTLEQAENLLSGSGILYLERVRHARALGLYAVADQAAVQAQAFSAATGWDHLVIGRYYLAAGDVRRALNEMDRSLQSEPQSIWAHFYKGICSLQLGHALEAIAEFSACLVLAPNMAWCHHNMGHAYAEAGELDLALVNFDRALALDPNLAASYLMRASVYQRKGRYADAFADLRRAADAGISLAEVDYRTALVYNASGDRAAAIASLRNCLQREPRHSGAQEALSRITASR